MDHVMTVTAEQGQIVDGSRALTALVQGFYMMAFDKALAKITVELLEVEPANLAYKRAATG